jgi:hypothetical protein
VCSPCLAPARFPLLQQTLIVQHSATWTAAYADIAASCCCCCRLFLSAEPPPALERGLPISLLQNSIKLTNEPPEGLRPNLRRAYNQFNEEILESCAKQVGALHNLPSSAASADLAHTSQPTLLC